MQSRLETVIASSEMQISELTAGTQTKGGVTDNNKNSESAVDLEADEQIPGETNNNPAVTPEEDQRLKFSLCKAKIQSLQEPLMLESLPDEIVLSEHTFPAHELCTCNE